jgi:hypothetical protein
VEINGGLDPLIREVTHGEMYQVYIVNNSRLVLFRYTQTEIQIIEMESFQLFTVERNFFPHLLTHYQHHTIQCPHRNSIPGESFRTSQEPAVIAISFTLKNVAAVGRPYACPPAG